MCAFSSNFTYRVVGFEELGNVDSFSTAILELRLLHTVRFSCAIKRHGLNIIMQGVIQKEPQSVPVVNNVRAMAAHGSRLLRQNHYHHDDFDL